LIKGDAMTNLLHLDSSITGLDSISRQLSASIVARCKELIPNLTIIRRDLVATPLALFSGIHLGSRAGETSDQLSELETPEERRALTELMSADILVLGAPMYNLTVPSHLKTWIDHITVAGKTFRYTPTGAIGLMTGKKVLIASSRGGIYSEGSSVSSFDHQEPYLRAVFGFLGMSDITIIRAEGVRISPEIAKTAIANALGASASLDLGAFLS
jgi:FMN-dependent NADH-azoreductase